MSEFTLEQLRMLLSLQELDSRIDADQAALQRAAEGAALQPAREQLAAARATAGQLTGQITGMRRDLRYQEQEAASLLAEIEDQEKRLYGGAVRNPKEAAQMQQHVASLRKRAAELDERALALMLAVEEFDPQVAAAGHEVERLQAELAQMEQAAATEVARLEGQVPEIVASRDALAAEVPPALMKQYQILRVRRAGIAVAALVDGTCSRCRMSIPYVMTREIRSGLLRTCDNCGRIVVEPA